MTTLLGPRTGNDILCTTSGGLARVTINRPDRLNGLTQDSFNDLADVIVAAGERADIRVIELRGAGKAFCAGADISPESVELLNDPTGTIDGVNRAVRAIVESPKAVVAVVHGPAAGAGAALALAADMVIAGRSAYFMLAFSKIGLMPDAGATALIAASIGRARAMRMAFTAERLSAADALEAGLVAMVFEDDALEAESQRVVEQLGAGPGAALRATKHAINAATLGHLEQSFAREREGQIVLLAAHDFKEGAAAFAGRRVPVFRDC